MLAEYLLQVRLKARDSGLYPALAKLPDLEVNDVCVDAGVGYLLVAVGVGDNFGDICLRGSGLPSSLYFLLT